MEVSASRIRAGAVTDGGEIARFAQRRLDLSDADVESMRAYLRRRQLQVHGKDTFGVVWDITSHCNLACRHCGVNARMSMRQSGDESELDTHSVMLGLERIADYVRGLNGVGHFLIFGGGEPFLRPDLPEILGRASELLGFQSVGVNTNGTVVDFTTLERVSKHLGTIEISVDGFETYHNAWRDPHSRSGLDNPFQTTVELVRQVAQNTDMAQKLEVSCVLTQENLLELEAFADYIASLGVRNFSVHRAMPVGRMAAETDSVLTRAQYARVAVVLNNMYEREAPFQDLHLHHSLESIFSVAFLGRDIHESELLMRSKRHSIGIDPHGGVYFDPWCMVHPYTQLEAGKIHAPSLSLDDLLHADDGLIALADSINARCNRCEKCCLPCSGGMRFNALSAYIAGLNRSKGEVGLPDLIVGLSKQDPACPFADPDEVAVFDA